MASNSHVNRPIGPKIELIKDLRLSSLPASLKKICLKWNCYCPDNILWSLQGPQGWVTLMPIAETGPKSNLSEILCLSSLSDKNGRFCPDHIFSIICHCETKGQVTLMWIFCSGPKLVQNVMAVCIICKSDEDLIKNEVAIVWTLFSCLLDPQGQVTLMPIVETGPKSYLSNILSMSKFSASLMKIHQKWSLYQPDNIFTMLCLWEPERAGNSYSHVNSHI